MVPNPYWYSYNTTPGQDSQWKVGGKVINCQRKNKFAVIFWLLAMSEKIYPGSLISIDALTRVEQG